MQLASAAETLTAQHVEYDPTYFTIDYPMGDIPADKGVCTDVVIRAYRLMGIDLQQVVHEDMRANFILYPDYWGLSRPDPNIDHRRVPNLMTFFSRYGEEVAVTADAEDFLPGDVVCWSLGGGITHIGIVSNQIATSGRPLIVHNIGNGQVLEDMLFRFTIIGHYRYGATTNVK